VKMSRVPHQPIPKLCSMHCIAAPRRDRLWYREDKASASSASWHQRSYSDSAVSCLPHGALPFVCRGHLLVGYSTLSCVLHCFLSKHIDDSLCSLRYILLLAPLASCSRDDVWEGVPRE